LLNPAFTERVILRRTVTAIKHIFTARRLDADVAYFDAGQQAGMMIL